MTITPLFKEMVQGEKKREVTPITGRQQEPIQRTYYREIYNNLDEIMLINCLTKQEAMTYYVQRKDTTWIPIENAYRIVRKGVFEGWDFLF